MIYFVIFDKVGFDDGIHDIFMGFGAKFTSAAWLNLVYFRMEPLSDRN